MGLAQLSVCLSACLSVCNVQTNNSKTKRRRKSTIGVNVAKGSELGYVHTDTNVSMSPSPGSHLRVVCH